MNSSRLAQYQYESEGWKRRLCFMMEESIHAKNRIAAVLKESADGSLLEELENFQTGFVEKDRLIALLRSEITSFDNLLLRKSFENVKNKALINTSEKKLHRETGSMEESFGSFLKSFRRFLSENV